MDSVTGTYEHTLDAKGRVAVPAKLRELLGPDCYLTMGVDACLTIYPQETWTRFTDKFTSLPMSKSRFMRPLFANAVKLEPDSQGRILVPQVLRRYAGLEKTVVFVGVHDRAEIWDLDRWNQMQEDMTPEQMAALMEDLEV